MAAYILPGFPVRSPRSGGSLQAPLFALRPGLSQERVDAPKEIDKGKKKQRKAHPVPLLLACRCHEGGRGQEQR